MQLFLSWPSAPYLNIKQNHMDAELLPILLGTTGSYRELVTGCCSQQKMVQTFFNTDMHKDRHSNRHAKR